MIFYHSRLACFRQAFLLVLILCYNAIYYTILFKVWNLFLYCNKYYRVLFGFIGFEG